MTRIAFITILVLALLLLAAGGWAVQGLRRVGRAARPSQQGPHVAPAPAGEDRRAALAVYP
jgi:hypothetical protein